MVQKLMGQSAQVLEKNRDYMEAFSVRLLNALGQKEAEQVCRENHWFGVLSQITRTKD